MEHNEIITARVTAVHRERYQLSTAEGDPRNYRNRGFRTSAEFGITAHKSVGLPAVECMMALELFPGGLEGITGQVRYDLDYESLR